MDADITLRVAALERWEATLRRKEQELLEREAALGRKQPHQPTHHSCVSRRIPSPSTLLPCTSPCGDDGPVVLPHAPEASSLQVSHAESSANSGLKHRTHLVPLSSDEALAHPPPYGTPKEKKLISSFSGAASLLTTSPPPSSSGCGSGSGVTSLRVYLASGKFLRSAVFGGLDGLTTSIVLICSTSGLVRDHLPAALHANADGVHHDTAAAGGVHLSTGVLFTLGLANLAADAFSMGMGDFLSSLAEAEHEESSSSGPGHGGGTSSVRWYRRPALVESARNGTAMFVSFVLFGILPLLAYAPFALLAEMLGSSHGSEKHRFTAACVLGLLSLFALGALKGHLTFSPPPPVVGTVSSHRHSSSLSLLAINSAQRQHQLAVLQSGLKMVLTGSIASLISFVVSLELHTDPT